MKVEFIVGLSLCLTAWLGALLWVDDGAVYIVGAILGHAILTRGGRR